MKALPEALQIAREQGLDLVEVAAAADPPVAKIMDHGKYKYEQDQRRKESKRKASNVVIKEMKFRPKIDGHDYTTKMKHVERFLEEGSKVKLTIMFRGREMAHPELGRRILERVAEQVGELAIIESSPKLDGRNMTMVLNPTRRPKGKGQGATKGAPKSGGHGSGEPESGERVDARTGRDRLTSPTTTPEPQEPNTERGPTMPKMKTHRGAAKRFKMTATGKIRRRQPNRAHLLEKKSSRRTRRLGRLVEVTGADRTRVQRLLGK